MDAMTFLGFIAIALAGGVTCAVLLKFLEFEPSVTHARQTRSAEVEPAVTSVAALPAFFAKLPPDEMPAAVFGFDDALVAFLQDHVKSERAMATRFVQFPSIDSLYRQAGPSPRMH